jgi:hypothetical protein
MKWPDEEGEAEQCKTRQRDDDVNKVDGDLLGGPRKK